MPNPPELNRWAWDAEVNRRRGNLRSAVAAARRNLDEVDAEADTGLPTRAARQLAIEAVEIAQLVAALEAAAQLAFVVETEPEPAPTGTE